MPMGWPIKPRPISPTLVLELAADSTDASHRAIRLNRQAAQCSARLAAEAWSILLDYGEGRFFRRTKKSVRQSWGGWGEEASPEFRPRRMRRASLHHSADASLPARQPGSTQAPRLRTSLPAAR